MDDFHEGGSGLLTVVEAVAEAGKNNVNGPNELLEGIPETIKEVFTEEDWGIYDEDEGDEAESTDAEINKIVAQALIFMGQEILDRMPNGD